MKSHDAIQEAIAGKTVEHAKALGLSSSLVNNWQEPAVDFSDSGALNPLDRVETIIHTAVRMKRSTQPYAPLHYLAAACNHVAIPVPCSNTNLKELTAELLDAVGAFGDLATECSAAMLDDDLSRKEFAAIEKQAFQACREIMEFVARAKVAAGG
jgi:hypothetical protein